MAAGAPCAAMLLLQSEVAMGTGSQEPDYANEQNCLHTAQLALIVGPAA